MNRRNFIKGILAAGAAFTVLPGAGRIWHVQRAPLVVPHKTLGGLLEEATIHLAPDGYDEKTGVWHNVGGAVLHWNRELSPEECRIARAEMTRRLNEST